MYRQAGLMNDRSSGVVDPVICRFDPQLTRGRWLRLVLPGATHNNTGQDNGGTK